jgi:hypothetical protein
MSAQKRRLATGLMWLVGMNIFSMEISFQEGDLEKDGVNISGSYGTEVTYIRSLAPTANEDYRSYAYVGTTSTTDFRRLLLGFDLSYLQTLAGSNAYMITSAELHLTKYNDTAGTGTSTFDLHQTDAFDETTATWNNSGAVNDLLSSLAVDTTATGGTVYVFSGADLTAAVSDVMESGTNTLYLLLKRRSEGGSGSYYVIVDGDSSSTLDARPELIVNMLVFPAPTDVPTGPSGMEASVQIGGEGVSLSESSQAGAPVIGMMNETARGGEVLVATGEGLSGVTCYYAANGEEPLLSSESDQFILNTAGNRASIILPTNSVFNGTTLVFAENDGVVSRPFH